MALRVAVWGTGNVGRPAIRAVLAHRELELAAVIVSSSTKVGRDGGELAGVAPAGIIATDDWREVLAHGGLEAPVYTANADTRGAVAFIELLACLEAGVNVASTAFYPLLYPSCGMREAVEPVQANCDRGKTSVFVSDIDPGWALDILPLLGKHQQQGIIRGGPLAQKAARLYLRSRQAPGMVQHIPETTVAGAAQNLVEDKALGQARVRSKMPQALDCLEATQNPLHRPRAETLHETLGKDGMQDAETRTFSPISRSTWLQDMRSKLSPTRFRG